MTVAITDLGLISGRVDMKIMDAKSSAGAGSSYSDFTRLWKKTAQVSGTFVASVKFEGSQDGSTWVVLGDLSTSGDIVTHESSLKFLRANIVNYTSGNVTITLQGATE